MYIHMCSAFFWYIASHLFASITSAVIPRMDREKNGMSPRCLLLLAADGHNLIELEGCIDIIIR